MSDKQYFHFTLGPVQSFVAQARRTRDFWSGSFILSWLSGVAMREVIAQCGDSRDQELLPKPEDVILFPKPEPQFLAWLVGDCEGENGPAQGSIPNRFKADVSGVDFKPENVVKAVQDAWWELAELVYESDLEELGQEKSAKERTRQIWEQQIKACWEITWAITDNVGDSAILDQSKNWRSYAPPHEPGVKCMMMEGWQELSGVETHDAKALEAFWGGLRKSGSKAIGSDLREREYLCAIAFVKRRFPHYFRYFGKKVEKGLFLSDGSQVHGWEVKSGRPSVSYMSAVHWLKSTILKTQDNSEPNNAKAVEEQLWKFHKSAFKLTKDHGSWDNNIRCISEVTPHKKWEALEGDVFFESALQNPNLFPLDKNGEQAKEVLRQLGRLKAKTGLSAPSPFYAVLMMDGDSLGKQMSDRNKQKAIAKGLQKFTCKVSGDEGIVHRNNGFLVYAGGDDVLAVLPLEDALPCALKIRECYEAIFAEDKDRLGVETSISAAIEFAHMNMPLTKVLSDAHRLLDDVAKDRCGRDSLAVRVWKPGGKALEWAMPWEAACEKDADGNNQLEIIRLCETLKGVDPQNQFSNGFFYKIREQLELLNPVVRPDPCGRMKKPVSGESVFGSGSLGDEDNPAVKLMAAEYVDSGLFDPGIDKDDKEYKRKQLVHAESVVRPLLKQCFPQKREFPERKKEGDKAPEPEYVSLDYCYYADAALLVRFLVHKGVL